MVKNINFSSVHHNRDLSLKLNPNRQHESRGILIFQNRVLDIKILNFHANETIVFTLKNVIFNESWFVNFEIVIGFMASKQV